MKKILSLLILAISIMAFSGCGKSQDTLLDLQTQGKGKPIQSEEELAKSREMYKDLKNVNAVTEDTAPPAEALVPFTLFSGTPPYVDPDPIVYKGRVELKGWIENVPAYVTGTEKDHFRVAEESVPQLPNDLLHKENRYYQLKSADEATMAELKTYSKDNPVTIIVDELIVVMEGNPFLNFVKLVK